jgi:hypothetical protein
MWKRSHVNYPLFLSGFNETWNFLDRLHNKFEISNLIKIRPVWADLFHADGWTDGLMDEQKDVKS